MVAPVIAAAGITAAASLAGHLAASRQKKKAAEAAARQAEEDRQQAKLVELFRMRQKSGSEYADKQNTAFASLMEGYGKILA